MKHFLLLCLVLISLPSVAQRSITSIELHNSNPETLLGALQAHINPPSSISLYQNRLIINATTAETKQLLALVKQLDGNTKTLFIAVKKGHQTQQYQRQTNIKPNIRFNNKSLPSTSEVKVTLTQKNLASTSTQTQGIRTVEGHPTWISTGQSKAFTTRQGTRNNTQTWETTSTGFYATAFTQGNTVRINLQQGQQQFTGSKTITSQQLQTTVHGPLNQWILVGFTYQGNQSQQRSNVILGRKNQKQGQSSPIYLKVSQ